MLKSLFSFVGGKARQAGWISSFINQCQHSTYVEVCCGSAAVFFAKQPSKIEILNDKERRYPLLFRALREKPEEVIDYCSRIEYSKAAFDESYIHLRTNPEELEEWKLGAWALFQVVASFNGYADAHSFAWRIKGPNPARAWQEKLGAIGPYVARLQGNVTFTNRDCLEMIKRSDKPNVLMYVDPPYVGAEFRYKVAKGFSHDALAVALHNVKRAKVILSHYYSEPYISNFRDWRVECMPSTQSCKGSTIHSPDDAKPVMEALWFNYLVDPTPE